MRTDVYFADKEIMRTVLRPVTANASTVMSWRICLTTDVNLEQLLELVSKHNLDNLNTPCCEVCEKIVSLKSKLESELNTLHKIIENPDYIPQTENALKLLREENKLLKEKYESKLKMMEISFEQINNSRNDMIAQLSNTEIQLEPYKSVVEEIRDFNSYELHSNITVKDIHEEITKILSKLDKN